MGNRKKKSLRKQHRNLVAKYSRELNTPSVQTDKKKAQKKGYKKHINNVEVD